MFRKGEGDPRPFLIASKMAAQRDYNERSQKKNSECAAIQSSFLQTTLLLLNY